MLGASQVLGPLPLAHFLHRTAPEGLRVFSRVSQNGVSLSSAAAESQAQSIPAWITLKVSHLTVWPPFLPSLSQFPQRSQVHWDHLFTQNFPNYRLSTRHCPP